MVGHQVVKCRIVTRRQVRKPRGEALIASRKVEFPHDSPGRQGADIREEDEVFFVEAIALQGKFTKSSTKLGRGVVGRKCRDSVRNRHSVPQHAAEDGEAAILRIQIFRVLRVIRQIDKPATGGAVGIVGLLRHGHCSAQIRNPWFVPHCGIGLDFRKRSSIQPKTAPLNHKSRHAPVDERLVVSASVHIE